MSGLYEELLTAAIQHLEELKDWGTKFVSLSHETLVGLENVSAPAGRSAEAAHQMVDDPNTSPWPAASRTSEQSRPQKLRTPAPWQIPLSTAAALQPQTMSTAQRPLATATASLSPEAKASAFTELRQRALAC